MILSPAYGPAQAKTRPADVSPADVSKEVEARTGRKINTSTKDAGWAAPEGVSLDDGLTEDESVAIALWNNPALQAEMTALGVARADVIEAGQLRNPSLTLIFPFSTRILESVANWPFEALWQRPRRVAAATLELERVGESLVSRALDLVRDTRLAYVDYALAQRQHRGRGDARTRQDLHDHQRQIPSRRHQRTGDERGASRCSAFCFCCMPISARFAWWRWSP